MSQGRLTPASAALFLRRNSRSTAVPMSESRERFEEAIA